MSNPTLHLRWLADLESKVGSNPAINAERHMVAAMTNEQRHETYASYSMSEYGITNYEQRRELARKESAA